MQGERQVARWMDAAKRVVPPEQHFDFDVTRDGWKELSAIVGVPPPSGDPPFPHPRSSESFTNCVAIGSNPGAFAKCFLLWLFLHAMNWQLFWGCWALLRAMAG